MRSIRTAATIFCLAAMPTTRVLRRAAPPYARACFLIQPISVQKASRVRATHVERPPMPSHQPASGGRRSYSTFMFSSSSVTDSDNDAAAFTTGNATTVALNGIGQALLAPELLPSPRPHKKSGHARRRERDAITYPPPPGPNDFADWTYQPRDFFRFEITHQSSRSAARVGRIHTPHGVVDTPGFVAVATNAALKGVDFGTADAMGSQLVFCNTYHLLLQPGADVIGAAGGLHAFTKRRHGPFITDSGGFQVFSLAHGSVFEDLQSGGGGELKRSSTSSKRYAGDYRENAVQVTEQGVLFRSYRDGRPMLLTPESTVLAQKQLRADIIIPLDELPGYYTDRATLAASVERTHRWEARSLQTHLNNVQQQAMYCVVHGGVDRELRTGSVDYLTSLPFDGYAIGGSLGNGRDELQTLLSWLMPQFDATTARAAKPRHLLGIADEPSIRNAVTQGVDTLDSCYPTRIARHGTVLSMDGPVRLKSGRQHARAFGVPIDASCDCPTCQTYDRAYLWHLFKANEPIAITLAVTHNLRYMNNLMARLRQDIVDDKI